MPSYLDRSAHELKAEYIKLSKQYQAYANQKFHLDMTRGKPCAEQLALSDALNTCLEKGDHLSEDGIDCRNYGGLDGIWEARRLFSELLDVQPDNVMVIGHSSLNIMYDMLVRCLIFQTPGADKPWIKEPDRAFICPVPGYDRHFTVTESLGFKMIPVPMTTEGPDMDRVEKLVSEDASIKGMWTVPVYSNPDGITYSLETCRRLAAMKTAEPGFRVFWDNAYSVHHLNPDQPETVPDPLKLEKDAGHPDRFLVFASTSKVTWAGSGMACVASSSRNLAFIREHMKAQTIGPDKMNQLRHARYLRDKETVMDHMRQHAEILRPKFDLVDAKLNEQVGDLGICRWNKPNGGYFFSLFVLPKTASRVIKLAGFCGVALTPAGSTWPYGNDPDDANIRLAPTFPPLDELEKAMDVLCLCIRLAALEQQLPAKERIVLQ